MTILKAYAVFLILAGMAGTALGPDHTTTAVAAGVMGGLGILWLARQATTKAQWAQTGLRTILGVFALTFAWRAVGAWSAVTAGNTLVQPIALLLTLVFGVTAVVGLLLLRR
ncbi:MAG: hypothetical protein ACKOAX_13115 [Candidatus Kapaibacterium sp.]